MTMMNHQRNTLVIVFRGTLARQEWCVRARVRRCPWFVCCLDQIHVCVFNPHFPSNTRAYDFQYNFATPGATDEFPGRVHQVCAERSFMR